MADPFFEHGLCPLGAGGGFIETPNGATTCVRADFFPPSFPCEYQWRINYDPSRMTPVSVVRADQVFGDFGPGSDIDWDASGGQLRAWIADVDGVFGFEPLRNSQFFPSSQAQLMIGWATNLVEGESTVLDGAGGTEFSYSSGLCQSVGINEGQSANVTVMKVPEAPAKLAGCAALLALWARRKER